LLVIAGIFDWLAYNTRIIAFQTSGSGFIALIGYIAIFYGFLADVFIFNAEIKGFDLAGALLIMVVTMVSAVYKLKQ